MVKQLDELGLLGPDTTYIHCNYLSDEEFKLIADTGGKVSIAPTVEMIMGHGTPPTAQALAHGLRPSLSIDVVTTVPGDMFTQMRFLFAQDRLLVARGGVRGRQRDRSRAAHVPPGARVRDHRGRARLRPRGPHRLAHAGQAGRRRDDPLRRHQHLPGHRPGLDRRAAGRHPQRRHRDRRRPRRSSATGALEGADLRRARELAAVVARATCSGHTPSSRTGCSRHARAPSAHAH